MGKRLSPRRHEYGDFQTPIALAREVCALIKSRGVEPEAVLEPSCGLGAFLGAALETFDRARSVTGLEVNPSYVSGARERLLSVVRVIEGDFFTFDWSALLSKIHGRLLILGNPPWVTNSDLSVLGSSNLPVKSNFSRERGLDARTGKSNFDLSESMLLSQVEWLKDRPGWIAVLVKTSVAFKFLTKLWREEAPAGRAEIYKIDAKRHFGVQVEACLLLIPFGQGRSEAFCDVFLSFGHSQPTTTLSLFNGRLVADRAAIEMYREFLQRQRFLRWRSGIKHDCAKVMELRRSSDGQLRNGHDELVDVEPESVFPLQKGSCLTSPIKIFEKFMIVPQREVGAETEVLEKDAPKLWSYLKSHEERLNGRKSSIYQNKPPFSIFGVGSYSFAPWKVAVSAMGRPVRFFKFGPVDERPVVFDDTVYFLPARTEDEADIFLQLIATPPFQELLGAMTFGHDKRFVTAEKLNGISLELIARAAGIALRPWSSGDGRSLDRSSVAEEPFELLDEWD